MLTRSVESQFGQRYSSEWDMAKAKHYPEAFFPNFAAIYVDAFLSALK
jgi:hypothetical protein